MTKREKRLWNARSRLWRFTRERAYTFRTADGLVTLWEPRAKPLELDIERPGVTDRIIAKLRDLDRALVNNDWRAFSRGRY